MGEKTDLVRTSYGILQGIKTTTKSGQPLLCFHGIPYAKPPVGSLRFKPPQPIDPWDGVYQADEEPPICPQYENGIYRGQEDCLYLNVYTPHLKPDNLKPVMVWIHGGGFVIGSGNTDLYGPDYLVDAGVVLVTFNYRLGVLGFLSLDNEDASGNMGLKDQVLVLKWVQQNITSFGGNPNNVTIFGESAGATCVNCHVLSSMSKGLFHKAIAQSGSVLNPWGFTTHCRARSFVLGQLLGFKTENDKELFHFLSTVEASDLVKASQNVLSRKDNTSGLKIVFVPTVEPIVQGQQPFMAQDPLISLRKGQFQHVPYITGTVTHEGMVNLRAIIRKPSLLDVLNEEFENVIPRLYRDGRNSSQIQEMCKKVRHFYFKDKPLSMDNITSFVDLNTDANMGTGIYTAAKYIAAASTAPVYYYNFEFDGELGCSKKAMGPKADIVSGPYHGDDIGYLFRLGLYDPELEPDSPEVKVREKFVRLWTNFAKTGNPTPHLTNEIPVKWLPFTIPQEKYFIIDRELKMDAHLWSERMAFWEALVFINKSKL